MSEQRDELTRAIGGTKELGCGCCSDYNYTQEQDRHADKLGEDPRAVAIADHLISAGYRKPRTVNTVAELEKLGRNSAVLSDGGVYVNDGDPDGEQWASLVEDFQGGPIWVGSADLTLPATVLYEATL